MKGKLQDIQALRGIAIGMVLLCHLSLLPWLGSHWQVPLYLPFYSGVELFFVISGFVVTRSILSGSGGAARFPDLASVAALPRNIRLSVVVLGDQHLERMADGAESVRADIDSYAGRVLASGGRDNLRSSDKLLDAKRARPATYLNGAMWSLSVEFQFYAAGAVGLALIGLGRCRLVDMKRAALGLAAITLALSTTSRLLWGIPTWPFLNYLIAWNFDFLLAGVCIALGWDELPTTWRESVYRFAFAGVIVMLIVAAFFPQPTFVNETRSRFVMPLMILAYAGIVAAGADERAFAWKGPIYRSMVWLGERSYSVYLFHFPVMAAIWFGLVRFTPPIWTIDPLHYDVAQMSLALLIVLPLSNLSLHWVENPARRLGSRWRKSLTQPKAVLAAEIA